jgi:hypothetical protein
MIYFRLAGQTGERQTQKLDKRTRSFSQQRNILTELVESHFILG